VSLVVETGSFLTEMLEINLTGLYCWARVSQIIKKIFSRKTE